MRTKESKIDTNTETVMADTPAAGIPTADIPTADTAQFKTAPLIDGTPEAPHVSPGPKTESVAVVPDHELDNMVDDIVVHESDELLGVRDADSLAASKAAQVSFGNRIKTVVANVFRTWWHNKLARYGAIAFVSLSIIGVAALPTGRYYVLNAAGVRTAASLSIIDNSTQLPLKNVSVSLGSVTSKTNENGIVKLDGLELGTQALEIRQIGFAPINKTLTLGWGSNPLGDFTLEAVGIQARYKLTNYLSGKPITYANLSSGDAHAQADKKGLVVLTLGEMPGTTADITITADGYRTEHQKLDVSKDITGQPIVVSMVPAQAEVFISKQNGKYDLYKIDVDGKNRQVLLAASGQEDADITVAQKPNGTQVAVVSIRDTMRNQDGFQLQALTLVNVASGNSLNLDHSERVQIVDWLEDQLIYIKVKAGTSAGNAERYQLVSYNIETGTRLQLAAANYFNDVVSVGGDLYVAASNNYLGGNSQFFKVGPDNTGRQVLLDKTDVWNIARVSYDKLTISSGTGTYEYKIGDNSSKKVSDSTTAGPETRFYLDAESRKHSLWTEKRDGKGVLLVHNNATGKDTVLATQNGLSYPVRWLGNRTIVYRVVTASETADYVVSLDGSDGSGGGTPKKIVDLTNTAGIGKLNYR